MIELANYNGNNNGTFSLTVYNHDTGQTARVSSTRTEGLQTIRMRDTQTRQIIDEITGSKGRVFSMDQVSQFIEAATPAWLQIIELDY